MKIQYFILIGMSVLLGWSFYMICNPPLCTSGFFCGYKYLDYANPYLMILILGLMFVVLPTGLSLSDSKKSSKKLKLTEVAD